MYIHTHNSLEYYVSVNSLLKSSVSMKWEVVFYFEFCVEFERLSVGTREYLSRLLVYNGTLMSMGEL